MKLEKNQIDDLQLQLTINIAAEDYAEPMKKRLNDVRRKAEFKGFRKGNVPDALIRKQIGNKNVTFSVKCCIIAESPAK